MKENSIIDVTCALIFLGNKILVTQRSEKMKLPLKWEFPGGKLEENELYYLNSDFSKLILCDRTLLFYFV